MSAKKSMIAVTAAALVLALVPSVQAERPSRAQKSPWQSVEQQVGTSFISIEYSRPGVRGRTIWGELVPYNEIWRAGANERTAVTFEDDVLINGQPLSAGSYGLLILPTEDEWTFIFSKNFMAHGSEGYDPENDALRVTATPHDAEFEEWMRYEFTGLSDNGCAINLHWENLRCGFTVKLAGAEDTD